MRYNYTFKNILDAIYVATYLEKILRYLNYSDRAKVRIASDEIEDSWMVFIQGPEEIDKDSLIKRAMKDITRCFKGDIITL